MICSVVLAAGRSSRMGVQKLLLPLAGRPMITTIVHEVLRSKASKAFVIVGSDARQVTHVLANRTLTFVANPEPDGDMLSSVRCGLGALPEDCTGVLVVLGDQPGITRELINNLVHCFREAGRGIVVPVFEGQRGHPLLFAARYCDEILAHHDATGLRGLLQEHPEDVFEMPVTNSSILEDLDTPEEYERRRKTARG